MDGVLVVIDRLGRSVLELEQAVASLQAKVEELESGE